MKKNINLLSAEFVHGVVKVNKGVILCLLKVKQITSLGKECMPKSVYCPFDITQKDFFAWRFVLTENTLF